MLQTEQEDELKISVRLSAGKRESIHIPSCCNVEKLKEAISLKTGKIPDTFSVVFSGKVLDDQGTIKDLRLGAHSVLHVISRPPNKANVDQPSPKHQDEGVSRYQFYVYCKTCENLEPGKLRVKCGMCQEGGVVLEKEPSNWDDVLSRNRLTCHCTTCRNEQHAQFYFKCTNHDGEDSAAPLRYIRPNSRSVACITCTEESNPVIVYPCKDKHVICVECFTMYCQVSLDNRRFIQDDSIGYTLPCPAGCEDSFIRDIHHFQLLGHAQYERYKDFGAEECLIQSGGVVCPQPGCGEGMIVDFSAKSVQCKTCQFEFCRQCRQEIHNGECQDAVADSLPDGYGNISAERALQAQWNSQSLDTISKLTKSCPKCGTRTERNGGCMHIACSRCREDWCWLCEKHWSRTCQGDHWFG